MYRTCFALVALLAAGAAAPAAIASEPAAETTRGVSFRGAPPFNRHVRTALRAADAVVARSVRSTGVSVRGRPPFKRGLDAGEAPRSVVFARLEETDQAPRRVRRAGPPGKRSPFITR